MQQRRKKHRKAGQSHDQIRVWRLDLEVARDPRLARGNSVLELSERGGGCSREGWRGLVGHDKESGFYFKGNRNPCKDYSRRIT